MPTYSTKIVLANHGSLDRVKSLLAKNRRLAINRSLRDPAAYAISSKRLSHPIMYFHSK